jgi:hypothetical protein
MTGSSDYYCEACHPGPVYTENLNPDVVVMKSAKDRMARRSPEWVLNAHPPDQRTEVRRDFGRPPRARDFQRQ